MHPDAIALFRELADRSPSEREDYFERHPPAAALRDDVESLLRFDRDTGGSLHECVASAAANLLTASSSDLHPGREIGPYRLVREIGRGGMGTVWIACRTDGALKRPVALKLLRWGHLDPPFTQRFERERDILAALTHPNIARLYDAGVTPSGQPYLALEYVNGDPLTTYADARDLDVRSRVALFLQVIDAVHHAHRNLVIHRDLKPGNILVSPDGVVHLLDFGIAKLLAEERSAVAATELTRLAGPLLTLEYASPEQVASAALTTASDIYSLGVVLYELLCGQRPYRLQRGTRAELEEAILTAEPPLPSRVVPDRKRARAFRADLDTILLKALRKNPADRYATADALSRDLRNFLDGKPVEARPDSRVYRLSKFVARHRAGVAVTGAVTIVILTSLAFAVVQMQEARAQRDVALFEARRASASLQLTSFLVGEARIGPGDRSISERLAKSRELVRRQFASEPAIRAELLFEIADKLAELRELATLADVMGEIEGLADRTNLPWLQARYRCAKAELKMNEGDTEGAAALIGEGFVQLARESPPQFGAQIECLLNDSYLAAMTGRFPLAIDRGREVTRLHEQRGLRDTHSYADAWSALATAYSFAGNVRGALDAVRSQRETYERLGQDGTFSHLTSLFLEATFLNRGGRRLEALARSGEVMAQSRARGLPDNHTQLAYRGVILLGVGRAREAVTLFDQAAGAFQARKMAFDELQMHILATDALLQLGAVRAARARLEPHWPAIDAQISANNASMTKGLRVRARVFEAEGRLAEARATIQRAVDIVIASKSATYTGAAAIFLSSAALALSAGDAAAALTDAERALERATRDAIDREASADIGDVLLLRARILRARGRLDEAERDASAARIHLRATLPADHPLLREAAVSAATIH